MNHNTEAENAISLTERAKREIAEIEDASFMTDASKMELIAKIKKYAAYHTFKEGDASFVVLKDWLPSPAREAFAKSDFGNLSENLVVVVTTYKDFPDCFDVQSFCRTSKAVLDSSFSGFSFEEKDLVDFLYKAVAAKLGIGPGWRAKSPSGSDWSTALEKNRSEDMLLYEAFKETVGAS